MKNAFNQNIKFYDTCIYMHTAYIETGKHFMHNYKYFWGAGLTHTKDHSWKIIKPENQAFMKFKYSE